MPTFMERYQQGEYEGVWADLEALGDRVREKEILADARAVAEETMRRARHNIETIIGRLQKLGYRFQTSARDAGDTLGRLSQAMAMFEAVAERRESARPLHGPAQQAADRTRSLLDSPLFRNMLGSLKQRAAESRQTDFSADPFNNPDIFAPPSKHAARDIRHLEKAIGGPLPLSLSAWCELVGSVSLMGTHPVLSFREGENGAPLTMYMSPTMLQGAAGSAYLNSMRSRGVNIVTELPTGQPTPLADPLVITPDLEDWEEDQDEGGNGKHSLALAPDDLHKANVSGDAYYMEIPNAAADAPFLDWHHTSFVNYLRIAFRWGGFPGWSRYEERPAKELAHLAESLLPI